MRRFSKANCSTVFALATLAPLAAAAQPVITSGFVGTAKVDINKPEPSPLIVLDITGTATGVYVQYQSPSGYQGSEAFFSNTSSGPGPGFSGKIALKGYAATTSGNGGILTPYAEPGKWTLTNISVCGSTGQCKQYNGANLTAIIPSPIFTVVNQNQPDITAPTLTKASIETPTIHLATNPVARIAVIAQDNLSGVNNIQALATNSSGTGIGFGNPPPLRAKTTGAFNLYSTLPSNQAAGTYNIQFVALNDIAGNFTIISDQATLLKLFNGKLSFTVVN